MEDKVMDEMKPTAQARYDAKFVSRPSNSSCWQCVQLIKEAYRDGAAVERARILALLNESAAKENVGQANAKKAGFDISASEHQHAAFVLRTVADKIEKETE